MWNKIFLVIKKSRLASLLLRYRLFITYAIIGTISASFDFIVFISLTRFISLNYMIANVISVSCGILNSFLFNRHFNFRVKSYPVKRFLIFYSIGLLGLIISSLVLWLFIEVFNINIIVSKLVTILLITILQFSLNKLITFKIN